MRCLSKQATAVTKAIGVTSSRAKLCFVLDRERSSRAGLGFYGLFSESKITKSMKLSFLPFKVRVFMRK